MRSGKGTSNATPPMTLRPQLEWLATATGQLSGRQVRLVGGMLAELSRLDRRRAALEAATAILDPDGVLSKALERALRRFDAVSRRRIEAGYRPPTALESALLALLDCGGPTCREKLYLELREPTARVNWT